MAARQLQLRGDGVLSGRGRRASGEPKVLVVALGFEVPTYPPDADVLVVAPALNSRLRHWFSDDDAARRRAGELASALVAELANRALRIEAMAADADPLQAIADALAVFEADEIVVAAGPERSSQADALVSRAQHRFALPVVRGGMPLVDAA